MEITEIQREKKVVGTRSGNSFVSIYCQIIYYDSIHKSTSYGNWEMTFLYAHVSIICSCRGRCEKKWLWTFFYHIHIIYNFFCGDIITNCVMHYTMIYEYEWSYIIALNFTSEQICISNSMWVCCYRCAAVCLIWGWWWYVYNLYYIFL